MGQILGSSHFGSSLVTRLHVFAIQIHALMIDSTMERGKLSSCIAYCIRRARNSESETAILYLWKALYSLAKDEEIPRKPILCLYDALQMHDEPPQHTHFVDGRGPKAPTVETAIQKHEIWTQTSGKVISELECKMLAQDIAQQMVAQAVAPLQAVVDQIQDQLHPPTALQSAPMLSQTVSMQTDSSPLFAIPSAATSAPDIAPTSGCPIPTCCTTPPDNGATLSRAEQKEARRRARTAELLARLAP